jgi:iron complex outermembrane receptor protein
MKYPGFWRYCILICFIILNVFNALAQQGSEMIPPDSSYQDQSYIDRKYIEQKERALTTSISELKYEEFNKGNINNPLQLIQGKVAGLAINKPGGDPNAIYEIRLRGLSTISCSLNPLIVVDGIIDGSLSNIDPNDIESITVLKDAASASIYGTRASSGVILIKTKKGKPGKSQVEYNFYGSAEKVARNPTAMNSTEWRALSEEVGTGTDYGENTDWFKQIEQTALSQTHNISVSGGSDKTTYRASVNYRAGEGVLINTGYSQLNGRINLTQNAFNDRLSIDMNMGATERESQYGFGETFHYASTYNPTAPVRSTDPEYVKYDGYYQNNLYDYYNPVAIAELDKNEGKNSIMSLSLKGTFKILPGLSVDALYSLQNISGTADQYYDSNELWRGFSRNGFASKQEDLSRNSFFETNAHYNSDLSEKINLRLSGGYSYQEFTNEGFATQAGNFLTDAFTFNNLNAALDYKNAYAEGTSYKNSNKLAAFFGQANLNFDNILFLTASARYDGSSRFGDNRKWSLFPAISAASDISKLFNTAGYFKIRASYGITGNQPDQSYMSQQHLATYGYQFYNGNFIPSYHVASNPNPYLEREKKSEFDFGIDFSLFKSKINGSFDVYTQTAIDLLYRFQVPVPPNLYYEIWLNMGEIKSSGVELTLNYAAIAKSDFTYNISFCSSINSKNTLVSLSGSYNGQPVSNTETYLGYLGPRGGSNPGMLEVEEGQPIGQFMLPTFKEIDENGNLILVDTDNNGYIGYEDREVAGNGLPGFLLGIGNDFTYKKWDLGVFFRGVL